MKYLILILLLLCCSCAPLIDELSRDPRDAPWDPDYSKGQSLFDQIPNWDQKQPNRVLTLR